MQVTGTITKIQDVQKGTSKDGKEWQKTGFLLDSGEKYNNLYFFTVFGQDRVDNFLKYNKVGSKVDVSFNVNTREWQGKYFTDLDAWKIYGLNATEMENNKSEASTSKEPVNDLPF